MFLRFLAATALALVFTQLGAMAVKIGILTQTLHAQSVAFLAVAIRPLVAVNVWFGGGISESRMSLVCLLEPVKRRSTDLLGH